MPIVFDSVVPLQVDGQDVDLVIHKGVSGRIIFCHSPLTGSVVTCSICADGARVYIS